MEMKENESTEMEQNNTQPVEDTGTSEHSEETAETNDHTVEESSEPVSVETEITEDEPEVSAPRGRKKKTTTEQAEDLTEDVEPENAESAEENPPEDKTEVAETVSEERSEVVPEELAADPKATEETEQQTDSDFEEVTAPEDMQADEEKPIESDITPEELATDPKATEETEQPTESDVEEVTAQEDMQADEEKSEESEKPVKRGRKKKESDEKDETISEQKQEDAEADQTPSPLVIAEEVSGFDMKTLLDVTEKVLETEHFSIIKDSMILLRKRFDVLENEYEQQVLEKDAKILEDDDEQQPEAVPETDEFKELSGRFRKLLSKYTKIRKQHIEKLEAEKLRNYDLKKQILEDLKQLVESEETLKKTWEDFKLLQQKWKEIGHVPQNQTQDLWNSFNHLVDMFLDKVKINRELRDLDSKKNLEMKLDICEKIEDLLLLESTDEAFSRLGDLQTQWRETGPVPSDKREELNDRFITAIEKLREKRRDVSESYRKELDHNLEVKRALVVSIKQVNDNEITSARAWGKRTEEVEELMKLWRNTGPVPRKYNEEIWKEFKSEMSRFFAEKKSFFTKIKDEFIENYNRKQLLCKQAESLQESTDWKNATQELIALQNEWKTIGPVPHRYSEPIWKQFRAACDVFFNRKKEFFSNLDKHEEENLKQKEDIIEQMLTYEFGEDNKQNLAAIKDFQRRFIEIGRVPIKSKDKIQARFQKTVEGLLEKLQITREEKQRFDIKQKYQELESSPRGKEEMRKESFSISSKINALEGDIQLWENNIEFFAKSKNADLLTREFRVKIDKAKAELVILKEKQKMLRRMI